jgi:hypothetical protein
MITTRYRMISCLVLLLVLFQAYPTLAEETRDQQSHPFDLAALAPFPQDFDVPGLGLCCGELRFRDEMAAAFEREGIAPAEEASRFLDRTGWKQRYIARYDIADPEDAAIREQISIAIDEYGDSDGAATGYDFWTSELADRPGYTSHGEPEERLGDQASVWTFASRPDGRVEQVRVVMVDDRFGLELTLESYSRNHALINDALAYAELFHQHVLDHAGQEHPDLGWKTLRVIDGLPRMMTFPDSYLRIDGRDAIRSLESTDELASRTAEFGDVESVYNFDFGLPNGGWYAVRIFALATEDEAEAFFDEIETSARQPDSPFGEIVVDAPAFGDESFVVQYQGANPLDRVTPVSGYTVRLRTGNVYIRLLYDAPQPPPLDAVTWLVETQLDCLSSNDPCPPVLFTAGMNKPLVVSEAIASQGDPWHAKSRILRRDRVSAPDWRSSSSAWRWSLGQCGG